MTREYMIERLIQNDTNDIEQELANGECYFLDNILRTGWKGYHVMTDAELEQEYKGREFDEADEAKARLEYLRGEILTESISYEEIAELQSLTEYIEPGDNLLLEWAGVPEKTEEEK